MRRLILLFFVFWVSVIVVTPCLGIVPFYKRFVCVDEETKTQAIQIIRQASPEKKKEIAASIILFFDQWDSQAITVHDCDYQTACKVSIIDFLNIGPLAIPLLWTELQKNTSNGFWAADCIVKIGHEAIPIILRALRDPVPGVRDDMVVGIGKTDMSEKDKTEIAKALIPLLDDTNDQVRANTCTTLGELGPSSVPAVPGLIEKLKDNDKYVPGFAMEALGNIGPGAKEAVPALIPFVHDKDKYVRMDAVEALYGIGEGLKSAIPDLIQAIHDEESEVRDPAFLALRQIGSGAKIAIPDLIQCLKGPDYDTVWHAAFALVAIDPKQSQSAVPIFIQTLHDSNPNYVEWAVEALRKIGTPEAIKALRDNQKRN